MSHTSTLLLTGATGLIGRSLWPLLARRYDDIRCLALVRHMSDTTALVNAGIPTVAGDLTRPSLGLSPDKSLAVKKHVIGIIHCAADIRFGIPLSQSRLVNLAGTRRLLRFARECPRLEKFAHVSTVYVAGCRPGCLPEMPAPYSPAFPNPYAQSKWEAEEAVLRAAAHLPVSIYRLSTVLSDSSSGTVTQVNYLHQLLKLALVSPLAAIPGNPDSPVDLITADWAASVLHLLFVHHFTPGEIFHICAGPDRCLPAQQLFDRTFDFIEHHGLARWDTGCRPRILDPHVFHSAAREFLSSPSRRRFWESLSLFLPHLSLMQTFDNRKVSALLGAGAPSFPDIPRTFDHVLENILLPAGR